MHDEIQQCLNKIKRYQSDLIAGNYARVTVVAKCFFKVPILQISAGRYYNRLCVDKMWRALKSRFPHDPSWLQNLFACLLRK